MSEFKHSEKIEGDSMFMTLQGNIDEDVEFPAVDASKFKKMVLDLQGIKAINSVGIREWLNWLKPISEKAQVILTKTPKAMVFQLNMVEGFLPKGGLVNSFFVPFYCEKCDKEENVLFNVGTEVVLTPGGPQIKFDVKTAKLCGQAECEMEMDASEAKYFGFLKKMGT